MDRLIRKIKIQTLHANLNLSHLVCALLARESCQAQLTTELNVRVVHRWNVVAREAVLLRARLEHLTKQQTQPPQPPPRLLALDLAAKIAQR